MKPAKLLGVFLVAIALVALLARPARSTLRTHYTLVDLVNSTGKYVYIDVVQPVRTDHKGLLKPAGQLDLRYVMDWPYYIYVHVYVKSHETDAASATICYTTKAFGNTGPYTTITEHIHYDGTHCSIH